MVCGRSKTHPAQSTGPEGKKNSGDGENFLLTFPFIEPSTVTPFTARFANCAALYASNSHVYHNGTYGGGIVGERIRGGAALETGRAGCSPDADCAGADSG